MKTLCLIVIGLLNLTPLVEPVLAQKDRMRGLNPPDRQERPIQIEFSANGQTLTALSAQGRDQFGQAVLAAESGRWRNRVVVVEGFAPACGSPAERAATAESRARAIRAGLLDQVALAGGQVLALRGSDAQRPADKDCGAATAHRPEPGAAIWLWQDQQMAHLADRLLPPPPDVEVSFWSRAQDGRPFVRLQDQAVLYSGDQFRISLEIREAVRVYVYIFHRESDGDWLCLFPGRAIPADMPPNNPLDPGRRYWLPSADEGYVLDNTLGVEQTFVYVGRQPHPELERWAAQGVAWQSQPADEDATVSVASPAQHMNWYRTLVFDHQ